MRSVVPAYLGVDLLVCEPGPLILFPRWRGWRGSLNSHLNIQPPPPNQLYALIVCGLGGGQEFIDWWRLGERTSFSQPWAQPASTLGAHLPAWLLWGHPRSCQWPLTLHPGSASKPNKLTGSLGGSVMDLYFGLSLRPWEMFTSPPGKEFLQKSSCRSMHGLIHWQGHNPPVQPLPKVPYLNIALWTKPPTPVPCGGGAFRIKALHWLYWVLPHRGNRMDKLHLRKLVKGWYQGVLRSRSMKGSGSLELY